MGISIGSSGLSDVFVGNSASTKTNIDKIVVGNSDGTGNTIWERSGGVPYIENGGDLIFICPDYYTGRCTYTFEIDFTFNTENEPYDTNWRGFHGFYWEGGTTRFYHSKTPYGSSSYIGQNYYGWNCNIKSACDYPLITNPKTSHGVFITTIDIRNNPLSYLVSVDGSEVASGTVSDGCQFATSRKGGGILCTVDYDALGNIIAKTPCSTGSRLFYFKEYEDDVLVHHYVPAKNNGSPCLYDNVTNQYLMPDQGTAIYGVLYS